MDKELNYIETYNFRPYLMQGEKKLYEARPVIQKKFSKYNLVGYIVSLIVLSYILFMLLVMNDYISIGVPIVIIFIIIIICSLFYTLFFKNKKISDDFYCLTNIIDLKYEYRKKKLICGYLKNYATIKIHSVVGECGDLTFEIKISESVRQGSSNIFSLMSNPNPNNMPVITFESIKDPISVKNIVIQAKSLLENVEEIDD